MTQTHEVTESLTGYGQEMQRMVDGVSPEMKELLCGDRIVTHRYLVQGKGILVVHEGTIEICYVRPEERRQGVARALIERALADRMKEQQKRRNPEPLYCYAMSTAMVALCRHYPAIVAIDFSHGKEVLE